MHNLPIRRKTAPKSAQTRPAGVAAAAGASGLGADGVGGEGKARELGRLGGSWTALLKRLLLIPFLQDVNSLYPPFLPTPIA